MEKIYKKSKFMKTLSFVCILILSWPISIFAQTTQAENVVETNGGAGTLGAVESIDLVAVETGSNEGSSAAASSQDLSPQIATEGSSSQVSASPQNGVSDQTATQGAVLEATFDPQQVGIESEENFSTTTNQDTISLDLASTTPPTTETSIDFVDKNQSEETNIPNDISLDEPEEELVIIQPEQVITEIIKVEEVLVAEITEADLVPDDKHTFKLGGSVIATKEKPDWKKTDAERKDRKSEKKISLVPDITPDDVEGTLNVSGSCADPYYVVLLYAKQEDYDKNPSSYIFNKAFECVSGAYDYALGKLPPTIADGKYFLLIGSQGEVGSWKPITALIPITIQKESPQNEQ